MSGGIAGDWNPALEYAVARLAHDLHQRGGRCLNCTRDGCRVDSWATEVLRRERVVRILLSGTLPANATLDDIRAALARVHVPEGG
ncbi:hypothetical protein [Plantactinospora sp. KLBMP9567]|uniref:hypothetical protein n=1 Tax=Plantactinospora sp. KLBMP9567 TaxID=3085900 RepID=UPI00298299F5|nr:hypothetical protein [Plantactinospora sp. KLBMP9567]MDW5322849.1 hypothetical protein [Plantactinospora sp. KLBMP9567]